MESCKWRFCSCTLTRSVTWTVLTGFFTITAVVLAGAYSCSLLSSLTVIVRLEPFQRIDDLANSLIKIGTYNSRMAEEFAQSESEIVRSLADRVVVLYLSHNSLTKAEQGDLVLADSKTSLQYQIRQRFTMYVTGVNCK